MVRVLENHHVVSRSKIKVRERGGGRGSANYYLFGRRGRGGEGMKC